MENKDDVIGTDARSTEMESNKVLSEEVIFEWGTEWQEDSHVKTETPQALSIREVKRWPVGQVYGQQGKSDTRVHVLPFFLNIVSDNKNLLGMWWQQLKSRS